jgi:hypothetical protein
VLASIGSTPSVKYALSLELTDAGFDFSILSEFRQRQGKNGSEQMILDRTLDVLREKKLLKARGRQRTDSTHVIAAVREMNRLELMAETLRATLNVLATIDPQWLQGVAPAEWYKRYSARIDHSRLPQGNKARREYTQQVGRDGVMLQDWLRQQRPNLLQLPAVVTLAEVWGRHFLHTISYQEVSYPEVPVPETSTPKVNLEEGNLETECDCDCDSSCDSDDDLDDRMGLDDRTEVNVIEKVIEHRGVKYRCKDSVKARLDKEMARAATAIDSPTMYKLVIPINMIYPGWVTKSI